MTQPPPPLQAQLSPEQIAKEAKLLDECLDLGSQYFRSLAELAECCGNPSEATKWLRAAATARRERREVSAKAAEYVKEMV